MCNANRYPPYHLLIVGRTNNDNLCKAAPAAVAERDKSGSIGSDCEEIKGVLPPFLRNGKQKNNFYLIV